jgi:hypothetical protein
VSNPNNIPVTLDVYIFGVGDVVLEGNNTILTLGPGEQAVISFIVKPSHASLHELTVKLFHDGYLFAELAYSYEVHSLILHPVMLLLMIGILLIIGSITLLFVFYKREKLVSVLKTETRALPPSPGQERTIFGEDKSSRKGEKQVTKDKKLPAPPPRPLETEMT